MSGYTIKSYWIKAEVLTRVNNPFPRTHRRPCAQCGMMVSLFRFHTRCDACHAAHDGEGVPVRKSMLT